MQYVKCRLQHLVAKHKIKIQLYTFAIFYTSFIMQIKKHLKYL